MPTPLERLHDLLLQARNLSAGLTALQAEIQDTPAPTSPPPTPGKLSTSVQGLAFLTKLEGLELSPYRDSAGIWTVGVGHVIRDGEEHLRQGITHDQAMALLVHDVAWAEDAVHGLKAPTPLSQNQFDALVCFCFNVGARAFTGSTLAKKVRAGDYNAVPTELMRWIYYTDARTGKKVVSKGLQNRRRQTGELWSRGDYTITWA